MAFHSKMGAPNSLRTGQSPSNLVQYQSTQSSPSKQATSEWTTELSYRTITTKSSSFLSSQLVYILSILILILATHPGSCHAEALLTIKEPMFTSWSQNVTYVSSTKYNARGMAPLYKTTNEVLDLFIGKKAIPDGYLVVSEKTIGFGRKVKDNEWGDLLKHYWAVLLVVVIGVLIIGLMPIIGLCFCCCRCAGACGGRSQPFDKKHDTCRRVFLGLLLICAATALLFGVVVAFVTNSYMQEGIEETTTTARHAVDDTKLFLDSTAAQFKYLLDQNYKELSKLLLLSLNDTQSKVVDELKTISKAVSLDSLVAFVSKLEDVRSNLTRAKELVNILRVKASQLNDALRGVKRELLTALSKCETEDCKTVLTKYEIGQLDANGIDYNQLPDVDPIIDGVDKLLQSDLRKNITKGEDILKSVEDKLRAEISRAIPKIENAINEAGNSISRQSQEIDRNLQKISNTIGNSTIKNINTADDYIKKYSMYRFYAEIAVSSVLLIVLICVTLALFCGICGKRPDGYGDDCCNKGSGSRFLMLGVTVIFLTISVVAAIALVHFLVGLIVHRAVCVPLHDPHDQVFNYIDNFIDLNKLLYPQAANSKPMSEFRISDLVVECRRNSSIYNVIRLYNAFNVNDLKSLRDDFKIDQRLKELIDGIVVDPVYFADQISEVFKELEDSPLNDFSSHKFIDNLSEGPTKKLGEIADELDRTADKIENHTTMQQVRTTLKNQALHLRSYETNLVTPMNSSTRELLAIVKTLDKDLQIGNSTFENNMKKIQEELKFAQDFINTNGTEAVKAIASNLTGRFTAYIDKYIERVIHATDKEIGQCGPLMNVYDASVVATCNKIADPFNGFWAGVAWCVLLFLPTLIISVKLSSLYQKSDPYPGPLVESEYLYDAYSERDNIPLANGPKNKKRKQKGRRHGSRDRRGDYYEDSGSSHGAPSGRDTRYSDMAPKHWDGGPPRYQNPPMAPPASEYERPPPYYYPGAPSEQD